VPWSRKVYVKEGLQLAKDLMQGLQPVPEVFEWGNEVGRVSLWMILRLCKECDGRNFGEILNLKITNLPITIRCNFTISAR
jgi:hypothetical protein